jgi:hypothetical protein
MVWLPDDSDVALSRPVRRAGGRSFPERQAFAHTAVLHIPEQRSAIEKTGIRARRCAVARSVETSSENGLSSSTEPLQSIQRPLCGQVWPLEADRNFMHKPRKNAAQMTGKMERPQRR